MNNFISKFLMALVFIIMVSTQLCAQDTRNPVLAPVKNQKRSAEQIKIETELNKLKKEDKVSNLERLLD